MRPHEPRLRSLTAGIALTSTMTLACLTGGALINPADAATPWPGHPGRTLVAYTVHPGDTATGLAVRFHAWTRELIAINHLGPGATLYVGQRITIPVVVAASKAHRTAPHRPAPHAAAQLTFAQKMERAGWRNYSMSREQVRATIIRTARDNGVPRDLALAIAWQESGWYQPLVSQAGAIGVMQVLPGTSDWMSLYASRHLNPRNTYDNVLAGVLFLRYLGDRSDGHPGRTIASYYQGMGALDPHIKWYDDTTRYVHSVKQIANNLQRTGRPTG